MAVIGDVGGLAGKPPGIRGSAEGASGRIASTRGATVWFAWPVACRRQRTDRRVTSGVRTWLGALRAARDGADHTSQYSRGGSVTRQLFRGPAVSRSSAMALACSPMNDDEMGGVRDQPRARDTISPGPGQLAGRGRGLGTRPGSAGGQTWPEAPVE